MKMKSNDKELKKQTLIAWTTLLYKQKLIDNTKFTSMIRDIRKL